MTMKTIGIAIDDWKLPIFTKHLDKAGYEYTQHPGLTAKTMLLRVQCDADEVMTKFKDLVQAVEVEARTRKKSLH